MWKRARVGLTSSVVAACAASWAGCQDGMGPEAFGLPAADPGADPGVDPGVDPAADSVTLGIVVRTATSGAAADADGYILKVDGDVGPHIGVGDTLSLGLPTGDHTVELTDMESQCAVDGDNPRIVTVLDGRTETSFAVICGGALTVVSQENVVGRPGEALAEPLAVRLTDGAGHGIPNIEVRWVVPEGDATLRDGFSPSSDDLVRETSTLTDADGLAHVPFTPLGFETFEVSASVWAAVGSPARFQVDATDPGATLAIASGNDQPTTAGQPLDAPLVAIVTDGQGGPVGPVRVVWNVENGDGDLDSDGVGHHLLQDTTWTGPDGLAQVSLTPTWFGPVEVSAFALGTGGSPLTFTADATDPGATLSLVSGDGQEGKAGEPLPQALVVEARNGSGNPAANVRVSWSVVEGSGRFDDESGRTSSSYTDAQGLARVSFSPRALGTVQMDAMLDGTGRAVTFTTEIDVLVIRYYEGWGRYIPPYFNGIAPCHPDGGYGTLDCEEEVVPLGTTVEWVSELSRARIVSTSRPTDGRGFDSGELSAGGRFQFVPNAVGTWEYVDQIRGTPGVLRVQ